MTKIDELINNFSDTEIVEFLEKVPLTVTINANVTAGFFGKAWGRVKATITYKGNVIKHVEKLL